MAPRFQFSLGTMLVVVCLIGPALLVLPWLAHSLFDVFTGPMLAVLWSTIGHPDVAGFILMVVVLCGIILMKTADKSGKL